jgi:hypothetical protein
MFIKAMRRSAYLFAVVTLSILLAAWLTPAWRPHIKHLLARSWEALVSASSASNFSVFYWTIGAGVVLWIVFVIDRWIPLYRRDVDPSLLGEKRSRWRKALRQLQLVGRAIRERGRDGLLGGLVILCLSAIAYGYFIIRTIYIDHESLVTYTSQLSNDNNIQKQRIASLQSENDVMRQNLQVEFVEPKTSLRRKTMQLVYELNDFWGKRAIPAQPAVQNPATDEERQRNAAWDKYWRDAKSEYVAKDYRHRLVGLVREYKTKGVDTGFMEQGFDQPERLVGAGVYGGWQLDNCGQYMNELCQLRELSFHVDAHDQRIDPQP